MVRCLHLLPPSFVVYTKCRLELHYCVPMILAQAYFLGEYLNKLCGVCLRSFFSSKRISSGENDSLTRKKLAH